MFLCSNCFHKSVLSAEFENSLSHCTPEFWIAGLSRLYSASGFGGPLSCCACISCVIVCELVDPCCRCCRPMHSAIITLDIITRMVLFFMQVPVMNMLLKIKTLEIE